MKLCRARVPPTAPCVPSDIALQVAAHVHQPGGAAKWRRSPRPRPIGLLPYIRTANGRRAQLDVAVIQLAHGVRARKLLPPCRVLFLRRRGIACFRPASFLRPDRWCVLTGLACVVPFSFFCSELVASRLGSCFSSPWPWRPSAVNCRWPAWDKLEGRVG